MKTLLPTSSLHYKLRSSSSGKWQVLCLALCSLLAYVVFTGRGCSPTSASIGHLGGPRRHNSGQEVLRAADIPHAIPLDLSKPPIIPNHVAPIPNPIAKPQAKVGWVTMLWGSQSETSTNQARAVKTQENYAKKHNYPFFYLQKNLYNWIWSKHSMLLSVILNERQKPDGQQLEWIVWADGDLIVMNPLVPIEKMLPPSNLGLDDIHFITTSDIFGLNTGAMMIRVSEYSIDLLIRSIAYPAMRPDVHLNSGDQSALEKIILEMPGVQDKVVRIPQRYFNAYRPGMLEGQVTKHGNLIMHFPGGNKKYMGDYLDIVESKEPSPWQIPYEETEYPVAIAEFWQMIKEQKDSGKPLYAPLIRN